MKKISQMIFIAAMLAALFLVPILTKAEPTQGYSIYENRMLEAPPFLSKESFFSGQYFADWEVYYSDHIVRRDKWLETYTWMEANVLHRPVVNDVILSKDVLLPYVSLPGGTAEKLDPEEIADGLWELCDRVEDYGGVFLCVGVPEQRSYFSDKYPRLLYSGAEEREADTMAFFKALKDRNVPALNMAEVFDEEGRPEKYYFKTDHHYNLLGAYNTYLHICENLETQGVEISVLTGDLFTWKLLENPFNGSRGRLLYGISEVKERLLVYEPTDLIPMKRTDDGEPVYDSVFRLPADNTSDVTYEVYMGGDRGHVVIDTGRDRMKNALVVGNSFTNALETFIYYSFNETHALDIRHYDEMSVAEYIDDFCPDVVVCVMDDLTYLSPDKNGILNLSGKDGK